MDFLDFEKPIAELEAKIEELRHLDGRVDVVKEVKNLEEKSRKLTEKIFNNLSEWQIANLARHPQRPYSLDYFNNIFTDFIELHGDRAFADDKSIVAGLAYLDSEPVMLIGQQKGRDTKEKIKRNFGMPRPEGYRKALRLAKLAEKFELPILTFVDTPGAYPGIDAEKRGQSEAIARNLLEFSEIKTPIISTVIGEGGSGGALAIAVADCNLMLQYSTFSIISPEGCASILWKDASKANLAAAALGVSAGKIHKLELIDDIIAEPLGGAHRNPEQMYLNLKQVLKSKLDLLTKEPIENLLNRRYNKLMNFGHFLES